MSLKILVVTQYFWPEDFRINELVAELSKRGHAITVLTGSPNYPEGKVFPEFVDNPDGFTAYHGADIIRVPMLARGTGHFRLLINYLSYALSATLFGMWRLRKEQYDAILVFEPSPITVGLPAIVLRAWKGWPIVFWVLDHWPETLSAVGVVKSRTGLELVGKLVSFIYSRCDAILSPSKSLMGKIGHYCHGRALIDYFPNWAESTYSNHATLPAAEVTDDPGKFNVMFAGNIGEAQDFSTILNAAEQLKDSNVRWLIVGDGRMSGWVKDEVDRRGLQKVFVLLGRYPINRMPSFYQHADALLVSLKPDPIFSMMVPGKLQSYFAFGVPVIGMLDGEGAMIIEEARSGVVASPGDAVALVSAIRKLADMTDEERRTMGMNGQAYANREFGKDILVTRLERILKDISHCRGRAIS